MKLMCFCYYENIAGHMHYDVTKLPGCVSFMLFQQAAGYNSRVEPSVISSHFMFKGIIK